MVLVGNVNARIVSLIGRYGGKGVGLSGKDGRLILAKKKAPVIVAGTGDEIDLGWVGETEIINPEILTITSGRGYIPVIAPIAVDLAGNSLNLNADTVSGDIAAALPECGYGIRGYRCCPLCKETDSANGRVRSAFGSV